GGQGYVAARHQGGDRRKLRTHPSLQPGRHGRAAVAVRRWPERAIARTQGRRSIRYRRPERRRGEGSRCCRQGRRRREALQSARPAADAERSRVLPPRRHPAVRAAATRGRRQGGLEFLLPGGVVATPLAAFALPATGDRIDRTALGQQSARAASERRGDVHGRTLALQFDVDGSKRHANGLVAQHFCAQKIVQTVAVDLAVVTGEIGAHVAYESTWITRFG